MNLLNFALAAIARPAPRPMGWADWLLCTVVVAGWYVVPGLVREWLEPSPPPRYPRRPPYHRRREGGGR